MNFFRLKVFFNISQADKPRELLVEASRWLIPYIVMITWLSRTSQGFPCL